VTVAEEGNKSYTKREWDVKKLRAKHEMQSTGYGPRAYIDNKTLQIPRSADLPLTL
jgi:hypothetical protein